ncbi:subunit J of translation initiation factor 3 [Chloropicon primus]|uniref:Subunit J of translation initiation factor 3 n=1 Tax=Chloropicon primus TaxID=1764295 RepID=A0A5B8MVD7_9CHLO|nr:subunit J of translation initiation factor 3 [Chloropicon primus]UPR03737.1 subunit J of translation initiation factor 3 [Chloropicon primus]|eukprot:QDZ24529.1 subunit J of translation initiation factor 3 [Chloropicon primus]
MDDDWDADEWEAEPLPAVGGAPQFEEEEEEEEEEVVVKKKPQKPTVKKVEKAPKNYHDPSDLFGMVDESAREDLERASAGIRKMTVSDGAKAESPLDTMPLKTLKNFQKYGQELVKLHLFKHRKQKQYKELLRTIIREACMDMKSVDVKEIETFCVGLRQERVKEEKALTDKAKKKPRNQLNAGARGGQGSYGDAGLDDAGYDSLDMDDFM